MRNDARPFGDAGNDSPSGLPAGQAPEQPVRPSGEPSEQPDAREAFRHDRQSHIINPEAESTQPAGPDDPITPSSDSTRGGRI